MHERGFLKSGSVDENIEKCTRKTKKVYTKMVKSVHLSWFSFIVFLRLSYTEFHATGYVEATWQVDGVSALVEGSDFHQLP